MMDVAIDACCLINLLAAKDVLPVSAVKKSHLRESGQRRTSHASEPTFHVPAIVAKESLYLLQPDRDTPAILVKTPIDLSPYISNGILNECDVEGDEETELFVGYAVKLDDGEAACLAIAKNRGWQIATDDRPATALARRDGVPVLSTAGLLKEWATRTKATKQQIAAAIKSIQDFAKFWPRAGSPEAKWWFSHAPRP